MDLKKRSFPVTQKKKASKTYFCFAYPSDLENAYAFYCARYENISYKDFLKLGASEFMMKFNSIPESEPLHQIIKSRTIDISTIKDKEERKYWSKLKMLNAIPSEYVSTQEIMLDLSKISKEDYYYA